MTYYRRPYSRHYRYSNNSRNSEAARRGPRKEFDITSYLKNEFFNADEKTFAKIARLYRDLYGYGAYKYLLETYYSWKSGYVRPSGQTITRILECVPRFLTDDKRFYILKCEIIYFIDTLHFKQQNKHASASEINTLFLNYGREIDNFDRVNLSWFVRKDIFTEIEIDQFLSVCKFALREKLALSYRQVHNDLTLVKSKLSGLKTGTYKANYQIDFLNSWVDLSQINESALDFVQFGRNEIQLEGVFRHRAEQYILEELMKMSFSEKEGALNRFIKSRDLDFFIGQYNDVRNNDGEASLKSQFKGEGGQLNLSLEVIRLKTLGVSIFVSSAKILLYLGIFSTAVVLIIVYHLYAISAVVLIMGGYMLVFGLLAGIYGEFGTLRKLSHDLKNYGR